MKQKKRLIRLGKIFLILALLALPLWKFHAAEPQEKKGPIRIGINMELTGVASESGNNVKMGYDLYLQEIGYKVAGREIKIIEYDNKTDPKISMEVAQKLVEKDHVHILCYGNNSAGAIAVRGYAEKIKVPMVVIGQAGAEQVTLPTSKWIYRLSYADGQMEVPLGRYAHEKLGYRKMTLMGPDFAGSTGKLWAFRQEFVKSGGEIVQSILWPLGEMDFAPYFAQLKPDCEAIFPFIPGGISINRFLSQYFEMGLDKKGIKLCTHWTFTADYLTIKTFGEKMLGIFSGSLYCPDFDSPENKHFKETYYAKYGTKKMVDAEGAAGYDSMKFLCTALEAINGNVEDTEAFLKAIRKTKIKGLSSKIISIDTNGNVVRDIVIQQVKKAEGVVKNVVIGVIPQCNQPPQGYTVMPGKGK